MAQNSISVRMNQLEALMIKVLTIKKNRLQNMSTSDDIVIIELCNTALRKCADSFNAHKDFLQRMNSVLDTDITRLEVNDSFNFAEDLSQKSINLYDASIGLMNICIKQDEINVSKAKI